MDIEICNLLFFQLWTQNTPATDTLARIYFNRGEGIFILCN